jgi:hypothetical protein
MSLPYGNWGADERELLREFISNSRPGGKCLFQLTWKQIAGRMNEEAPARGINRRKYTTNSCKGEYSRHIKPHWEQNAQNDYASSQYQGDGELGPANDVQVQLPWPSMLVGNSSMHLQVAGGESAQRQYPQQQVTLNNSASSQQIASGGVVPTQTAQGQLPWPSMLVDGFAKNQ